MTSQAARNAARMVASAAFRSAVLCPPEERASAVKAYLVMKGIAADRVHTSANLRPDRRAWIEVSGTRLAR